LNKKSISFAVQLLALLVLIGILHASYLYTRNFPIGIDLILLGYAVNFALALAIYIILVRFAELQNKNLGFIFLFGSMLKFVVYFIFFDPLFTGDGNLSKQEFFSFFIPYLACLIVETVALAKLLREMD